MQSTKRGKLIIIEGGEGCGKTSHAKSLVDYLIANKRAAEYCREPGSILSAERIRGILLNKEYNLHPITEIFLFEAARTEFYFHVVEPKLNSGNDIVCDRSGYSTEAYQGFGSGQDKRFIRQLNKRATINIQPDLVFIIAIDPLTGLSKEEIPDRFAAKGIEYHTKVNKGYIKIAQRVGAIIIPYRGGEFDEMQKEIRNTVEEKLSLIS